MIPGDIAAALGVRASGTWRPAPGGAPGSYATSLPFLMASEAGAEPAKIAADLAGRLRGESWIEAARVTGGGYLTVTVTAARSLALPSASPRPAPPARPATRCAARRFPHPPQTTRPAAPTWAAARQLVADAVTGRAAQCSGATLA